MADHVRNQGPNKYNSTPRKVFDKHVDRMELKRQRDKEDHRADLKLVFQQLRAIQNQLANLEEHVASHCQDLADPSLVKGSKFLTDVSTEEL